MTQTVLTASRYFSHKPVLTPFLLLLAFMLFSSLLSGCATTTVDDEDNDQELTTIEDQKARRLIRSGKLIEAADRYTTLASKADDALTREDYQLVAAEILYDRGLYAEGLERLEAIPNQLQTPLYQQRYRILQAKHRLFSNDAEGALESLPAAEFVNHPIHRARVHEVQAQAYQMLDAPGLELQSRIQLEQQLKDPAVIDQNHARIWRLLTSQPVSRLRELTINVQNDTYQGWLELAIAHGSHAPSDPQYQQALLRWQQKFPNHVANPRFLASLTSGEPIATLDLPGQPVNRIAVLLPLTVPGIDSAANAIRDGIIVAYQNDLDRASPPELRFYDTGNNPTLVRSVYQQAIDDGADAIIGPLMKDAVSAIATLRSVPVPTLTLNYVEQGQVAAGALVQFGLAPEDEAREAARRALALGLRQAIVLQSDDSRGDRESRAFQEEMLLNGGDIVYSAVLPPDTYDFSPQIRDALLISQGDQRFHRLSQTVPGKIHFEPSIRDDLDTIFLAVSSEEAQSVRPQLAFFRASHVPLFSTSRIVVAVDDSRAKKDLNTIQFPDTPWALDPAIRNDPVYKEVVRHFDEADGVFAKLYALGLDSYNLMTNLAALEATQQGNPLQGYTGNLSLNGKGAIQRGLPWGKYVNGSIELLPPVEYTRILSSSGVTSSRL